MEVATDPRPQYPKGHMDRTDCGAVSTHKIEVKEARIQEWLRSAVSFAHITI